MYNGAFTQAQYVLQGGEKDKYRIWVRQTDRKVDREGWRVHDEGSRGKAGQDVHVPCCARLVEPSRLGGPDWSRVSFWMRYTVTSSCCCHDLFYQIGCCHVMVYT